MVEDVTVIIQAAGEPYVDWWKMDVRKQMVLIGDEPLVARTQRQCKELGYRPFIVSNHEEILAVAERPFVPAKCLYHLETFLSTRELWKGWVFILFGDAVWADATLRFVLEQRGSPLFFKAGGTGIHAWMFHEKDADKFVDIVSAMIEEKKRGFVDFYWRVGGGDLSLSCPDDGLFTTDFDHDVEYESWIKKWSKIVDEGW